MSHGKHEDSINTKFGPVKITLASEIENIQDSGVPSVSLFVPGEAEGAIPNGTRVEKCNTESSDSLFNGAQGTVMASHDVGDLRRDVKYLYFVDFDRFPGIEVLISDLRIRPLSPDQSQGGTPPRP